MKAVIPKAKTNPLHSLAIAASTKKGSARPIVARRVKQPAPEIFVRIPRPKSDHYYYGSGMTYAAAHLRNKAGYAYLCWREGERVRTFYLGKAPNHPLRISRAPDPRPAGPRRDRVG